jgi:hypothetical protein
VANPNPYRARLTKALRRKPGDLDDTRRRCWGVLCLAYDEVAAAEDADTRRKAALAFAQLVGSYTKLYELAELEPRLTAIEAALHRRPS